MGAAAPPLSRSGNSTTTQTIPDDCHAYAQAEHEFAGAFVDLEFSARIFCKRNATQARRCYIVVPGPWHAATELPSYDGGELHEEESQRQCRVE